MENLDNIHTITGTGESDFITGTLGDDYIEALAGDDYIAGNGGNDIILGGDGDEDIRIEAGYNLVYGGLGWDSLEIDDTTSDYVYIGFDDNQKGYVQGYSEDNVMLYETDFESIERFVAVSEMGFRYVGNGGRDHIKIYSMP